VPRRYAKNALHYVQFPIMRSVLDMCLQYLSAPTKRCA